MDVIVQSGVKLSPEYDVGLGVALLWFDQHQGHNRSRIEVMKSHKRHMSNVSAVIFSSNCRICSEEEWICMLHFGHQRQC